MNLTENQKTQIGIAFEKAFQNEVEMAEFFYQTDEYAYEEIINQFVSDDGEYSTIAPISAFDHTMTFINKVDTDAWVHALEADYDIDGMESQEDLQALINDNNVIMTTIFNNLNNIDIGLEIFSTPEDVNDRYPDDNTFSNDFYNNYDELVFKEYLEQNPELINDEYNDAAIDEFGSLDNAPDNAVFDIDTLELIGDVADKLYKSKYDGDSVYRYMILTDEMYRDIVDLKAFKVTISIEYEDDVVALEQNPTVEYLEEEFEAAFDEHDYIDFLKENDESLIDEANAQLQEEGITSNEHYVSLSGLDSDYIDYEIKLSNINLTGLANHVYDNNIVPEKHDEVYHYINSEDFFEDIYGYEFVVASIEITSSL